MKSQKSTENNMHIILIFLCVVLINGVNCFNLTLMHTNDVHAKFQEFNKYSAVCSEEESNDGECFGGMARHVTITREIRQSEDNVIYLNAGDFFQGTVWYIYYKGAATAYFTKKLGIDAACLGNHEFDDGMEVLSEYLKNISFPIVTCNLDASNEPLIKDLYQPSILLNVGGEQIGVVGYITQETKKIVIPDYLENVVFEDEIETIRREVNSLLSAGVDKIFLVGHGGFMLDQQIAKEVEGIDVIVGGHSNTFLYTGDPPSNEEPVGPYPYVVERDNGDKVLLVQAYGYGKYMGYLQLSFDDEGVVTSYQGNPILLDSSVDQDADTLNEIKEWHEPLEDIVYTQIGKSYVDLNGSREECRARECNMGNLLTDAILFSYLIGPEVPGDYWTDISIAVWNGGAIRASIGQGSITVGNVFETAPFRNEIVGFKLQGRIIWEMLEHSVLDYNPIDLDGGFLQMSGLKVEYNLWRPSGQRVVKVQARCAECLVPQYEELDMNKMYGILTSNFLLTGGDGYAMIKDNAVDFLPIGKVTADVVVDYITQHSPIITGLEGRISFTKNDIPPSPSHASRSLAATSFVGLIMSFICVLYQ